MTTFILRINKALSKRQRLLRVQHHASAQHLSMGQDSTLDGRLLAGEDESSLQLTLKLLFLMNTVFR
jgi:hypothetical protein